MCLDNNHTVFIQKGTIVPTAVLKQVQAVAASTAATDRKDNQTRARAMSLLYTRFIPGSSPFKRALYRAV